MTPTKTQAPSSVVAPKATDQRVPPIATPPATAVGPIGFVTGKGTGPKPTAKGASR
jgi:hypothetical protein